MFILLSESFTSLYTGITYTVLNNGGRKELRMSSNQLSDSCPVLAKPLQ